MIGGGGTFAAGWGFAWVDVVGIIWWACGRVFLKSMPGCIVVSLLGDEGLAVASLTMEDRERVRIMGLFASKVGFGGEKRKGL